MATKITLPGGLWSEGRLLRVATLRTITGRLERRLALLSRRPAVPSRVTGILAACISSIDAVPMSESVAAALSVCDRQFLMLCVALQFGTDQQWRHLTCGHCAAPFDVGYRLSELPLGTGADSYPHALLQFAGRRWQLRVPTGADETEIARLEPYQARRALARRCVVAIDGEAPDPALALDDAAIDAIDAMLDSVTPQVAPSLSTACTQCAAPHQLDIDPYAAATPNLAELYGEVHRLALHYHWSETQCLRLPRERRQLYLDLLEQSGSVMQHAS